MAIRSPRTLGFAAALASMGALLVAPAPASACGCFSPPVPGPVDDFAVNQQSEQIIFEVPGDGTITAHVLIKYEGSPEQFAWLVPVPSVPDLALSETLAFAVIDQETAPQISVSNRNVCPDPEFVCRYHSQPFCGGTSTSDTSVQDTRPEDAAASDTTGNALPGGVEVLQSQQVGDYQTVVFSADEAAGTVTWLRDNGFIVNDTMTPFMQPYLDAGMLFIAAKLVPGADVIAIRPLKMTYVHPRPIIPLKLTAVAAEPHLAVTSYIFANTAFRPMGHPLATIDRARISHVGQRSNYPMVMSRTIDEAGRDAFVREFTAPPPAWLQDATGSCNLIGDGGAILENDGVCQCPRAAFDEADCNEAQPGLLDALTLLDDLGQRYSTLTRLTTRLSPEEMTFDAQFEADADAQTHGRQQFDALRYALLGCDSDVVDPAARAVIEAKAECATVYCGEGECVSTSAGAGCRCNAGHVARTFTDLDGRASVTCQPRQALVDLGADIEVPSSCEGVVIDNGTCIDVGGFPSSDCMATTGGVLNAQPGAPLCVTIQREVGSPGAENFSAALKDLDVCSPRPERCGAGWLVPNPNRSIAGIDCPQNRADPSEFDVPPAPECPDGSDTTTSDARSDGGDNGGGGNLGGSGCQGGDLGGSWPLVLSLLAMVGITRRRLTGARS